MINEVIGQKILKYEVFEPWCMSADAQIDGTPVFGALVMHTHHAVLTLSSRLRFSMLATTAESSYGLIVSIMPRESWSLQRDRWLAHSASCGSRTFGWYSYPTHTVNETPFLPVRTGWKITDIYLHPRGQDAVILGFDQVPSPVAFSYRADFDGGICWAAPKLAAPKTISPFLPEGEFAWLHPAAKIEVWYEHGLLKSAIFEDWPLSLRRSVFGTQEAPNGEPLRRSAQLLLIPQLRSAYLKVVSELMAQRFIQYPILTRRLGALTATVNPAEDFGAMVNSSLSEWLLAPVHYCPTVPI